MSPIYYDSDSPSRDDFESFSDDPTYSAEGRARKPFHKKLMLLAGIGIASIGFTSAASINLGVGNKEFGVGVLQANVCTTTNNIKIKATTDGSLKLKTITLSDVPTSCNGKNIILSLLKPGAAGTSDLNEFFGSVNRLRLLLRDDTFWASTSDTSNLSLTTTLESGKNTVVITFNTAIIAAADIGTFGIESSDNTLTSLPCGAGGDCVVGGTGPGGGIVLFTGLNFSAPGSACDLACNGLEISLNDRNRSGVFSTNTGSTGATATGMGAGYTNTKTWFESPNGGNRSSATNSAMGYCWNKSTASATDRWYLPSVMEYAYIFAQVKASSAFRTAASSFPAVTDYVTSEEATGFSSAYATTFTNGGPPSGITPLVQVVGPSSAKYLGVQPKNSAGNAVTNTYSDFAQLTIYDHPKNAGNAFICLHAFK